MFGCQKGQATIEWLAAGFIVLVLLAAVPVALRDTIRPGEVVRDALREIGLLAPAEPPPPPPLANLRGREEEPPIGRALRGAARSVAGGARATGSTLARAGGEVIEAVGPQGEAFLRGFTARLEEAVVGLAGRPSARSIAERVLNGAWELTPHAQLIRNAISGTRIVVAGLRRGSLTAASEQAGREAADRVVGYLIRRGREAGRGAPPRPPAPRPDPPASGLSTPS